MDKGMISVSMMCVRIDLTMDYLKAFERNNVELLHIDVMDGAFVPNITIGVDYVKQLREITKQTFDFHFMVEEPEEKMKWFDIREGDWVSVHWEATKHIDKCMQYIKSLGAKPCIALNPGTPISVLEEMYGYLDGVLLLSVNPGFAGQKLIPSVVDKVRRMSEHLKAIGREDITIIADGNMSNENAKLMYDAGARIFVAGTSSIVKDTIEGVDERIAAKRKSIGY
ncbi:MAG: ribulose-phosphate 3-epimerase [Ruminococcus sp.]|nr:ribulose-phosphate 3-epimerase [Ruminococcus sp.]